MLGLYLTNKLGDVCLSFFRFQMWMSSLTSLIHVWCKWDFLNNVFTSCILDVCTCMPITGSVVIYSFVLLGWYCVVPENIHTTPQTEFHLGTPHLPGFSILILWGTNQFSSGLSLMKSLMEGPHSWNLLKRILWYRCEQVRPFVSMHTAIKIP